MARAKCCACGELFSSDYAFNKHRTGSYGNPIYGSNKRVVGYTKSERRCLSEQEMVDNGLRENNEGIWTTGEFDASVFEKAAQSSLVDTSAY